MPANHRSEDHSTAFVVVVSGFITALLTANIIAVKPLVAAGWILPAGIVIFPISYILGDVLTEVYGYRRARQVIWLGFACNVLAVSAIALAGVLPAAPFWKGQEAYELILGYTPRLLLASFIAYLMGEFANAFVLAKLKIATEGRWLWTRTIGSTLVGQLLDSAVFITLAFAGVWLLDDLVWSIFIQWIAKSGYEAAATPLTYLIITYLKRREGQDAYDRDVDFNPLKLGS